MLATPTSRPQTLQPAYMTHRTNRSRSPRRRFFHSASKKASGPREAAIDPRAARLSSASASWQKHWRQRRRAAATGAEHERLPTAKRPAGRTLAVVLSGHRGDRLRTARSRLGRAPRPGTSEPARQWLSPRCECSCCSRSWRPFGDVSGATRLALALAPRRLRRRGCSGRHPGPAQARPRARRRAPRPGDAPPDRPRGPPLARQRWWRSPAGRPTGHGRPECRG